MASLKSSPIRFESVDAFRMWERTQPGCWELHAGEAVAMVPERVGHTRIKAKAWKALDRALRDRIIGCEALFAGGAVRVGADRSFRPDALVTCGEREADDSREVALPVVVVEVLSPSTQHIDVSIKLDGYFELASVQHYLVMSSMERLVVHHRRDDGPRLLTRLYRSGPIDLDPPGIRIDVDALYDGTDWAEPPSRTGISR